MVLLRLHIANLGEALKGHLGAREPMGCDWDKAGLLSKDLPERWQKWWLAHLLGGASQGPVNAKAENGRMDTSLLAGISGTNCHCKHGHAVPCTPSCDDVMAYSEPPIELSFQVPE